MEGGIQIQKRIIFLHDISSPLKTPLSAFVQEEIGVHTESVMAVIDGDILALTLKNNLKCWAVRLTICHLNILCSNNKIVYNIGVHSSVCIYLIYSSLGEKYLRIVNFKNKRKTLVSI